MTHTLPVSVIIPSWNEAKNLETVLGNMPPVEQLIIVDGHSTDNTVGVVNRVAPNAEIISQKATGKGNAVLAGIRAATAPYVVSMDADGSMNPADIGRFIRYLGYGAHVVKGSRTMPLGGSSDFTVTRRAGNLALTKMYNIATGHSMTDITFGYIGLRRDVINMLDLTATGFEIEVQIVAHAHQRGLLVSEIPCYENNRISGSSHLNVWRDGMRILKTIVGAK